MSKAEVINAILETMTMAEFDKVTSAVGVSAKTREKIMRIYENSNMTKRSRGNTEQVAVTFHIYPYLLIL